LFLGDLFHIWVGDRRYETRQIGACVPAIRRVRERGIETVYIEGNRDFFLSGSVYASAFTEVTLEHSFVCGGVRYLAAHGDGINAADRRYLFWRWLSKSALSRALFQRIPGRAARAIVHRAERKLARTNFRHRRHLPVQALEAFGRDRLKQGHDVVLLGHFHRDWNCQIGKGEVRIVDAWYQTPALLWLQGGGCMYGDRVEIEPCLAERTNRSKGQ
jgi:UDP-2,3-diacylglucosamine hydrolase